jgi:hypothetical protein
MSRLWQEIETSVGARKDSRLEILLFGVEIAL